MPQKKYYAVTGPRGNINRVTEGEPQFISEGAQAVKITKAQYEQIKDSPKGNSYILVGDELKETRPFLREYRWDTETDGWVLRPPPPMVSAWAFRAQLKLEGVYNDVIDFLNTLDDPQKTVALEVFEHGNVFVRESPTIEAVRQFLNRTHEEVDQLFRDASKLKP